VGVLKDSWIMRRNFHDLHPRDKVLVPKEERSFCCCKRCGMQVNPKYTRHSRLQECQTRMDRVPQKELALDLALVLCHHFSVHREVLE
jgi:hypothetical protein